MERIASLLVAADRLALVLEPEAAAIAALASMEPSEAARVVPGTKILIMDCGGETGEGRLCLFFVCLTCA